MGDPPASRRLIDQVRAGKAGVAELAAGGATQVGAVPANGCPYTEYPETFPFSGNWPAPLYAASVPGVHRARA